MKVSILDVSSARPQTPSTQLCTTPIAQFQQQSLRDFNKMDQGKPK
jgi:hypothetical protein